MATELDLSIIIVNWNSAAFVRKCLSSIYANTRTIRFEIIVIDNASHDGCGAMIERDFPAVRFIQSADNSGFARANNLAFQHSSGRNILFLNPDTEVVGPAIERLVQFLDSKSQAGVVGARLLNSDHSVQTSCIQRYPTLLNQVLDADFLRERFRNWQLWGTGPLFKSPEKHAPVEVVSGACQMIRKEVFEQVGLYDVGYFMYAEDVDLCFKAQEARWRNYYVGDAVVVHHGGRSSEATGGNDFATVMMHESRYRFFLLRRGRVDAKAYRALMALTALFRIGLLVSFIIVTLGCFKRTALSAAVNKWVKVFRWSVGLEGWAASLLSREICGEHIT
jgi:GT2 family glycosyltransferase